MGGEAQCLRIGVQEDIFVFNHTQAFGKLKNLQLGKVRIHSASELGSRRTFLFLTIFRHVTKNQPYFDPSTHAPVRRGILPL